MKLQDAFIAENGDYMGDFTKIGYEMQSTTSFAYSTTISGTETLATKAKAWSAKSKVALNDCVSGTEWNLQLDKSSTGNGAKWTASYAVGAESKCSILTPRFLDMSRGS